VVLVPALPRDPRRGGLGTARPKRAAPSPGKYRNASTPLFTTKSTAPSPSMSASWTPAVDSEVLGLLSRAILLRQLRPS
jgi:hypothetical protein